MDALFALMKRLSVIVMLVTLADLLLPDGAMRRYARLCSGLLMMLVLLSPLLTFLAGAA